MDLNEKTIVLSNGLSLSEDVSKELLEITSSIEKIESELKKFHELQKQYESFRQKLFDVMTKNNVIKYVSLGGIQFTIVSGTNDKTEIVLKFNEDKFKAENPELYKKYLEQIEKTTKGRSSYLRITLPKGE